MNIITVDTLASLLGVSPTELAQNNRAKQIIEHTNGLITEKWVRPVDPAPTSVKLLALAVAERAWTHTPGQRRPQSVTKTSDNTSKTERYDNSETAAGHGVYLTEDELKTLRGGRRRRRTIRTATPGVTY